jgi:hypothetical protein
MIAEADISYDTQDYEATGQLIYLASPHSILIASTVRINPVYTEAMS